MTHCLVLFRQAKNLTQDDLAELLGSFDDVKVAGNTVARWERGETIPQKKYRKKLVEITGLAADRIVSDCLAMADRA